MKTNFIFSALFFFLASACFSQAPVVSWQRTYGGSDDDVAEDVQKTSDGGVIVCGYNGSKDGDLTGISNVSVSNYWVFKLDANHNLQWSKIYGGSKNDEPHSVCQAADGGYIIAGSSLSNDGDVTGHHGTTEEMDFWVIKLDVNGNLIWQKSFGGTLSESANMVQQLADGSFIIAGYAESNDGDVTGNPYSGSTSYWVVKLNSTGTLISQKIYGGVKEDQATSIQQLKNGQFIIAGFSNSSTGDVTGHHGTTTTSDSWVVKTDASGNIIWQVSLGGTENEVAYDVRQAKGGGFIVAGYSQSALTGAHGKADYCLWKLSDAGDLLWQHLYGGSEDDFAYDVDLTKDGSYIVSGSSHSNDGDITDHYGTNSYEDDFWVIKTNPSGDILWQKSLGGNLSDHAVASQVMQDGTIYVLGNGASTDGEGVGNHSFDDDLFLIQLGTIPVNTIGEMVPSENAPCWGESLTADFAATGTWQPGNVFTAQVSKNKYDMIEMITIGTLASATPGSIPITMPSDLKPGEHNLRVISSAPLIYGAIGVDVTDGINLKCKKPDKGLHTASVTATSAIPTWDDVGGCTTYYVVRWRPSNSSIWNYTNTNDAQLVLTGLVPATDYMWGVQSLCVVTPLVSSQYSPMKNFTTLPQKLNKDGEEPSAFELYPIPATTMLHVKCNAEDQSSLVITNAVGQVVFHQPFTAPEMLIDVSSFVNGMYVVSLKTTDAAIVRKFLKD